MPEGVIPTTLELGGNQPVIGIDCIVLTSRASDLVARLFEREL